jgi:hypothetical protein
MKKQGTKTLDNLTQKVDCLKLFLMLFAFCCLMIMPDLSFSAWTGTVEIVDASDYFGLSQRSIAIDSFNHPHSVCR